MSARHFLVHARLLTTLLATLLVGCEQDSVEPFKLPRTAEISAGSAQQVAASSEYAWRRSLDIVQRCQQQMQQLRKDSARLATQADADSLAAARASWHSAHQTILLLSPLFSLGDANPGLMQQLQHNRFEIDGWPIEPGYLDYFGVYAHSGIVNDIAIPITAEAVRAQHWLTSEQDIALGFHAIAYLLWGEQQQRSSSDYTPQTLTEEQQQSGLSVIDLPNQRRIALLQLQIELLHDDLNLLADRLRQETSALSASYRALPPAVRLELWRAGLQHLLQRQLEHDLSPATQPDSDWYYHNQFAGGTAAALAGELLGIKQVLLHHGKNQQALGHWLLAEAQSGAQIGVTAGHLDSAITLLEGYGEPWPQLPQDMAQTLRQHLQAILQQLQ